MIDITKFEGHTAGPWRLENSGRYKVAAIGAAGIYADVMPADCLTPDSRLIAAAPDLLAEVIRLRAALYSIDRQLGHDDRDDALRELTLPGGQRVVTADTRKDIA